MKASFCPSWWGAATPEARKTPDGAAVEWPETSTSDRLPRSGALAPRPQLSHPGEPNGPRTGLRRKPRFRWSQSIEWCPVLHKLHRCVRPLDLLSASPLFHPSVSFADTKTILPAHPDVWDKRRIFPHPDHGLAQVFGEFFCGDPRFNFDCAHALMLLR